MDQATIKSIEDMVISMEEGGGGGGGGVVYALALNDDQVHYQIYLILYQSEAIVNTDP